jgi:hypothetical protein
MIIRICLYFLLSLMLAACGNNIQVGEVVNVGGSSADEGTSIFDDAGNEFQNTELVGHHDLSGRASYHPIPHRYGDRVIFYVGHHAGEALNPLTGETETNGMSILDVTDASNPVLIHHEPPHSPESRFTQHIQLCDGSALPNADPEKVYLIRTSDGIGVELMDATNPEDPVYLMDIYETGYTDRGQRQTHKIQWDCESGIAYLNGTPEGWRVPRVLQIFDMSNPETPMHIRDFALDGSQPGAEGDYIGTPLHQPYVAGDRVYMGYGASNDGVIQVLDKDRLLNGDPNASDPFAPTTENLNYPQISRLDMPTRYGAHTVKPILGIEVPDYEDNLENSMIDLLLVVSEETTEDCAANRDAMFLVDFTEQDKLFPISSFQVPEEPGDYCHRGVRFGPHSPQDYVHPNYDKQIVVLAYFNGGVRIVDIRDPYNPEEVGYFVPAVNETTFEMCSDASGQELCATQIQTNNVNLDHRGYIYALDRSGSGVHILSLTGDAAAIVDL